MKKSKIFAAISASLLLSGLTEVKAQETWTGSPAGTTQPYLFSTYSSGNTPQVGIGAFSTTTLPSADLHISTALPTIKFQPSIAASGSGSSGLTWTGTGGAYALQTTWWQNAGSSRLHMVSSSNNFGTHLSGSNMIFGSDVYGPGVTTLGTFTFNGEIGTSSLAISPTLSLGPGGGPGYGLFTLPTGTIFGVNGNSYLGGVTTIGVASSTANNLIVNGTTTMNGGLTVTGSTIGDAGSTATNLTINGDATLYSPSSPHFILQSSTASTVNTATWGIATGATEFSYTASTGDAVLRIAAGNSTANGQPASVANNLIIANQTGGSINFTTSPSTNPGVNNDAVVMQVSSAGQVGIGMSPSASSTGLLQVNGQIEATSIKVELVSNNNGVLSFPDYVFAKDYKLKSLSDLEKFISENNHLPGIPSAEEVKNDGINVAEMDVKLLEKIEELTLYMIEVKKEIKTLQKENVQLKEQLKSNK